MNSFFSSIINRVRSFKEEDLRDFVSKKSRVDDVVVSHYLDNQDKFNFSDSLKIGDKELEKSLMNYLKGLIQYLNLILKILIRY